MWGFNLPLLRLLGEIFVSLLCSHSSWGSALDLTLLLCVGHLRASVLYSDRTVLKEQLNSKLWLTQAGGKEGYGILGEPVVAESGMVLQQPEAHHVFSWESCLWIMGPWPWWAAQSLGRGGVDSDLCLHTGFLMAAAAAFAFHAHLWVCADSRSSRPSLELV